MAKIKLIIADDQVLFLNGLRLLINTFETIELVAEAKNGQELLDLIPLHQPDVILVDLKMPIMNGIEATSIIKDKYPDIKVLLLSMYNDESIINHVMKNGANGYLLKNEEPHILREAIETVVAKGFYFNEYVSKALLKDVRQPSVQSKINRLGHELKLTRREVEILKLICQQYTSNEIAEQLYLSVRTVEGHRKRLLDKTGVRNIVGLVLFAVKHQFV
ncbi:MAG: response regulator transcription factor [Bacteroidota bacterium]